MTQVPQGWQIVENTLTRTFICKNFVHAVELLNAIAKTAEELQHHPDITIRNYKELLIATTTHSENSITKKDYELANKINDILES